jgi:hypothetical protein
LKDHSLLLSTTAVERLELRPSVVRISVAGKLLGDKSRSEIYEAIADGKLDAVKDGHKTLITVASIERYIAALPRAKIGADLSAAPLENNSSTQKLQLPRLKIGDGLSAAPYDNNSSTRKSE